MSMLEVQGVTKRFGALAAVDSVDFAIKQGEILGLIGPNGAGKTTLVNVMAGSEPITAGTVHFKGRNITAWPAYKVAELGIGRTFQVPKPLERMNVLENVMVGALFGRAHRPREMRHVRDLALETLQLVGLEGKTNFGVGALTVADRKRVELAKALAMDPELLFLDEVMAGLNPVEIEKVMDLIRQINAQGMTILVIEHVMKAVMGLCNRILVIHHGKRIALDTPQAVCDDDHVIEAYLGEKYAAAKAQRAQ
jgi:branched-chain amino acid transport system ATP-binding protein